MFDIPHHIRQPVCRSQAYQKMNMVGSSSNYFRDTAEGSYCAADEGVKSQSPVLNNDWLTVFGTEHNVVMQTKMS